MPSLLGDAGRLVILLLAVTGALYLLGHDPASAIKPSSMIEATAEPIETTTPSDGGLQLRVAAVAVYNFTNDVRADESVDTVTWNNDLAAIARQHSQDMARHDYVGHTEPDGDTVNDRLDQHPNPCDGYGDDRFEHGENAGSAYWQREFVQSGTGDLVYVSDETELAKALMRSWLNSPGHRKNIVADDWNYLGVGLAINQTSGKVYATQLFC